MKNFYRVAQNVDVRAVMLSLVGKEDLWNQNKFRTTYPNTPFTQVDDIWLRFSDPSKCTTDAKEMGDANSVWHEAAMLVPVKALVLDIMRLTESYQLDRLIITRLGPGKTIARHADNAGPYTQHPDRKRYHVVLQGLPGSLYNVGDETVQMLTGEVWWFDALKEHEIVNNSTDDRIHMLVDLVTWPTQIAVTDS